MRFPDSYFTVEDHLFKVSCNRVYQGEQAGKPCIMAEMNIKEVKFTV